jgi:hypothetical protein
MIQRDAGSAVKLLVIDLLVALAIVVGIMVLWSYVLCVPSCEQ